MIEGDWSGRVTGLRDQRDEIAMMRMPDGHGRIELSRFLTPPGVADHRNAPVNALGYLPSCSRWTTSATRRPGAERALGRHSGTLAQPLADVRAPPAPTSCGAGCLLLV